MSSNAVPELRRSSRAATKRVLPDYVNDQVITAAVKKPRPSKPTKAATATARESENKSKKAPTAPSKKSKKPVAKSTEKDVEAAVDIGGKENFGGLREGDMLPTDLPEVKTHSGETTTLSALVDASEKGIVIFAYPKASTPGCTTQACSFRDNYSTFKNGGFAVYGLSGDTPAANEKFSSKYTLGEIKLLCDPKYELHGRLQIKKSPKGTIRSIIVIGKKDNGAIILRKGPANPAQSVAMAQKAAGITPPSGTESG